MTRGIRHSGSSSQAAASHALTSSNGLTAVMAADARWLKLKLLWQNMSREKQGRALGLLFIIAVAFIWVPPHQAICLERWNLSQSSALWDEALLGCCHCTLLVQVLASFLVQDLEAEGLNPFLLTYIANSLFIIYLPAYALAKRIAARGLKGRQDFHSSEHNAALLMLKNQLYASRAPAASVVGL